MNKLGQVEVILLQSSLLTEANLTEFERQKKLIFKPYSLKFARSVRPYSIYFKTSNTLVDFYNRSITLRMYNGKVSTQSWIDGAIKCIGRKDEKGRRWTEIKRRNKNGKTQLDTGLLYAISRIKEKQNGEYTNIKKTATLAENLKGRKGGMKWNKSHDFFKTQCSKWLKTLMRRQMHWFKWDKKKKKKLILSSIMEIKWVREWLPPKIHWNKTNLGLFFLLVKKMEAQTEENLKVFFFKSIWYIASCVVYLFKREPN